MLFRGLKEVEMKIRLLFKDQRPDKQIEAGSWLIEDGLVKFFSARTPLKGTAVYDMDCLLGFEVASS